MTDEHLVTFDDVDGVIRLGELALAFGRVKRITMHPDGQTPESDTDHTVMLGVVACAIAQQWFPGLSTGRVAQYALVHDVVEVYAGDHPTLRALTAEAKAQKASAEKAAAGRIYQEFGRTYPWLPAMILSYEDGATPEARFVRMLDKLLPKITHLLNAAATIRREGMTYDQLAARYHLQALELDRYAVEFPELDQLRHALVQRVLAQIEEGSDRG
jgi:putative hydrolase of HD superfamily